MDRLLDGKRALVTGASSGIGRAIAEAMAGAGARVAVHARTVAKAGATLDAIARGGGRAVAVAADMTRSEEIEAMCEAALKALGGLDIVVNNAGVYDHASVAGMSEELWDRILDTDLKAPFLVSRFTVPALIEAGRGGSLTFMASSSSKSADARFSAYNAAKHGLMGLARCLAAELGAQGIRVNGICPGWIDTKMAAGFFASWPGSSAPDYAAFRREEMAGTNMLKRVGRPRDIADFAVYLASERGRFITGQAINVCGGLVYW